MTEKNLDYHVKYYRCSVMARTNHNGIKFFRYRFHNFFGAGSQIQWSIVCVLAEFDIPFLWHNGPVFANRMGRCYTQHLRVKSYVLVQVEPSDVGFKVLHDLRVMAINWVRIRPRKIVSLTCLNVPLRAFTYIWKSLNAIISLVVLI